MIMRTLAVTALVRAPALAAVGLAVFASAPLAQVAPAGTPATPVKPSRESKVFRSTTPLPITFTVNFKRIRGDRGDSVPWRQATLSLADDDGKPITIPIRVRTRGIWRLKNCEFPPIRLNFKSGVAKHTELHGLDKPKLVNFCRNSDPYEEYILQEFQLYRVYNLITPVSHRVRLLRMTYVDSASGKVEATRYAFLEEEPEALAERIGGSVVKEKGALPGDLNPEQDALFGVFQYMIGNTDFSENALHNVELIRMADMSISPVAYDFDYSGAVNTRYAVPDPKLTIKRVRDRLFRGYCAPPDAYDRAFARFRQQKDSIYALYHDDLGRLLRKGDVEETLSYFDEFYETISDPRLAKRRIVEECLGPR